MKSYFAAKSAYWSAVFLGMSSPYQVWHVNHYSYPHGSELDAMRSDWMQVGQDITKAIKKGNVQTEA